MTMKSKDIHIALKRDDCINYLLERFGFENKEDLFEAIRKVNPSGAEDLIRKLEKKQKRNDRRVKTNTVSELTDEKEIQQEEQPVQNSEEEVIIVNVEENSDEEIEQEENMQKLPGIEQLKAQEQELSAMLCNLEGQHKNLVAKRMELRESLRKAQNALKELLRILNLQETNVTNIYEQYQKCASEMDAINQEHKSYKALLEDVRKQISDRKKVTILVYQNGDIEVENADVETPVISEEEVRSEFARLIYMPEAGEITVYEVMNIAKLLKMVKVYEADGYTPELMFDSTKAQKLWETVIA